jgi:hypothetical protein
MNCHMTLCNTVLRKFTNTEFSNYAVNPFAKHAGLVSFSAYAQASCNKKQALGNNGYNKPGQLHFPSVETLSSGASSD